MSFLSSLTAKLPFFQKPEVSESFFALNIRSEKLTAALWTIEGNKLKILDTATDSYLSRDDIIRITDRLLDVVVGDKQIDPQKILFGVPDFWLVDENLKDEYLKLLRKLVKELEVTPMAYVSKTHALAHFLEGQEGVPATAVLVGIEEKHVAVTIVRAGKPDGTKVAQRSDDLGVDIEKLLLAFTGVEVLPSKILIYGLADADLEKIKSELLSFSWMSNLSFLHFPKIETLSHDVEITSICFAGASEIKEGVVYMQTEYKKHVTNASDLLSDDTEERIVGKKEPARRSLDVGGEEKEEDDLGFVVGDVSKKEEIAKSKIKDRRGLFSDENQRSKIEDEEIAEETAEVENMETAENPLEVEDFESEMEDTVTPPARARQDMAASTSPDGQSLQIRSSVNLDFLRKVVPKGSKHLLLLAVIVGIFAIIIGAYLFFLKADVKVYVEPKILENDTQVTADPTVKTVDETNKKIPGQIIETDVAGSGNGSASGKKQVGDPAKGTVVIYNKTSDSQSIAKGTTLTASGGLKFALDVSVTIASQSASDSGITYGKSNATVTASAIGADSNLPSSSELTVAGFQAGQVSAKAEGNFSGGNSKDVTVVSDADQQKLLAQVAADLRKSAQQKLQEKLPDKKILEEALSENITKKSFSKNIGDQTSSFSLNLTAHYKGTAYDDKDLRTIVSKLVSTNVPEGFSLDLGSSETQADVSKIEKDGKVIFLARFKAKLIPSLDKDSIKKQIEGKSVNEAIDIIKSNSNVLGAEIKLTPNLPGFLASLPILGKNIDIEVGYK